MTTLTERIGKAYDETPYVSSAFPATAPEHLRTVAHLFGLDAPSPTRARVLELGCAAGGNLIPFAARHPKTQVLGVDLSPVQIQAGVQVVADSGLKNLRLMQASIADLDASLGQFDYIICHGVYSWVPEEIREAILRVCSQCLAQDGIAYVSYNTYPGWKAKEVVRDAMLLRAGNRTDTAERLAYARGMIDFLHDMAAKDTVLAKIMAENIQTIRHGEDYYLSHEFLELCNAPCYFRDFVAAAERHDLAYLGESHFSAMFPSNYGAEQAKLLLAECAGEQLVLEQLIDFLSNRTFRQTLLVHPHKTETVRYRLDAGRIARLHVAGRFTAASDDGVSWTSTKGQTITASEAVTQAAIAALNAAWPGTVAVERLVEGAQASGNQGGKDKLLSLLTELIVANAIQCRLDPVVLNPAVPERPSLRPSLLRLARLQGKAPVTLFNEWHQAVNPGVTVSFLLPLLDGTRDRAALTDALIAAVGDGTLEFKREGQPLQEPADIALSAADAVEEGLRWLSGNAMLVEQMKDDGAPAGRSTRGKRPGPSP